MPTRKQQEVSELLRREISEIILRQMNDPRMGFVALTRVETSADLRTAQVFVTVRDAEGEPQRTLKALRHARGYIQELIGQRLKLRYTPVLSFTEDTQVSTYRRVTELLDEMRRDKEKEITGM